jgi:acyl-CoA dehydrogenase
MHLARRENPTARFYRELGVDRIWEGTSEIQRWVISRGVFKRGAAQYLAGE